MPRKTIRTRRDIISRNLCAWAAEQCPMLELTFDQVEAMTEAIFYGNTLPISKKEAAK